MSRREDARKVLSLVTELELDGDDVEAGLRFWAALRNLGGPAAVQAARWRAGKRPAGGSTEDVELMVELMVDVLNGECTQSDELE